MYVRVDVEECKEEIEGFSYRNLDDNLEVVTVNDGTCNIHAYNYASVPIYYEDVHKLIKALKAAYKQGTGYSL